MLSAQSGAVQSGRGRFSGTFLKESTKERFSKIEQSSIFMGVSLVLSLQRKDDSRDRDRVYLPGPPRLPQPSCGGVKTPPYKLTETGTVIEVRRGAMSPAGENILMGPAAFRQIVGAAWMRPVDVCGVICLALCRPLPRLCRAGS